MIEPKLFLIALKLRIGAPFFSESFECFRCRFKDMDCNGFHALCCAKGESTKGHYRVCDCVLELTHLADPSAETEVLNLFPDAPTLRPADIFTTAALPGRMAALDIGICSPDASGAGIDCCDTMHDKKIDKYRDHLVGRDFIYCPLVFSCYGRVHPECMSILRCIAQGAARRRGILDFRGFLSRLHRNIGVAIWRRAAAMVHNCTPTLNDSHRNLLDGSEFRGIDLMHGVDAARVVRHSV